MSEKHWKQPVSVRVPAAIREQLINLAVERDTTASRLAARAITEFLERERGRDDADA
jgi:predicted transcriptional regulator